MGIEEQNPESGEFKHPADLACDWHGHVFGNSDFVGTRYTENEEDGRAWLTFYIGTACLRCGEVQESELDEAGIDAVARYG